MITQACFVAMVISRGFTFEDVVGVFLFEQTKTLLHLETYISSFLGIRKCFRLQNQGIYALQVYRVHSLRLGKDKKTTCFCRAFFSELQ